MRREQRQRGNIAVLFTVMLTVLLGFAALAIDLSYVRNARMQLSNAVDASAHAAMIEYRRSTDVDSARAKAKEIALSNIVGDKKLTLKDSDIVFGSWDFDSRTFSEGGAFINACQVSASRGDASSDGPLTLFFAPIIGHTSADAAATSTGAFRFREIMMVQDVTGSFMQEMDDGRAADVGFLDYIYANQFPQDKIGLVVFANVAHEYDVLQNIDANYATLRAHWAGDGTETCDDCTAFARTNPTNTCGEYNDVQTGIQVCHKCDQTDCNAAAQCCDTANPTKWGPPFTKCNDNVSCSDGAMATSALYLEGTAPASGLKAGVDALIDGGTPGNIKVIVFVGDGKPQCCVGCIPAERMNETCPTNLANEAFDQKARAEDASISIYTVSLYTGNDATAQAEQEQFMRDLVTGYGRAYSTEDSSDLSGILLDIARSLPVAIVE